MEQTQPPPARATQRLPAPRPGYPGRDYLAIPKLRQGTYFPEWLLERRKRAETALIAIGVNTDGRREVLGLRVATSKTEAAWNSFFADLVARGLSLVRLVTSDAHQGLVEAIAANLPARSGNAPAPTTPPT